MSFSRHLRTIQHTTGSLLCIGLDTDPRMIPRHVRKSADPVTEFNRSIIDLTYDLVCAYKFNLAFYEAAGEAGHTSLRRTLAHIPRGIVTIGDGKRGDIGNSAEHYAAALFDDLGFTACTVNPYMGFDAVEPFLRRPGRGAFVLALTSNAGARDFQYQKTGGTPLYERVIARTRAWNVNDNCGIVVGATRRGQIGRARKLAGSMPMLIPGVGAQGGDLRTAVVDGCAAGGDMAVINVGRSVIYASGGTDFATAARKAAMTLRDEIDRHREKRTSQIKHQK